MYNLIKYPLAILFSSLLLIGCQDIGNNLPLPEETTFNQADQVARPAINTVFVSQGEKDNFNTTIPSDLQSSYTSAFEDRLLALNPGYTENLLGLDSTQFAGVLAADVLNVTTSGKTTFFDGTNVLTGRALADDVIDVELTLIFGGSDGSENPELTSDNVDSNDREFQDTFPYLAPDHQ